MARSEHLPRATKLYFGAPAFAGAAMVVTVAVHMPRFYSDVVLAPLGYVALMTAVARAFDAITDPLMGWITDRTRTRWGRRKPFIALGVPISALGFWMLLAPPRGSAPGAMALWFGLTFALLFLGSTIATIPRLALGAELTLDYHERSSLFGIQSIFLAAGTMLAAALPGLLEDGLGIADQRIVFTIVGGSYAGLLILLNVGLLLRVHERPEFVARPSNPLIPGVRRALRNRPFRILLLSGIVNAIPASIPPILIPYFTYYVIRPERPATWLATFLLLYLGAGFVFLPAWIALARRHGKLRALIAAGAMGISGSVLYFFAGEGDTTFVCWVYLYTGVASGAFLFLIPAMGADVIDYDELRTGKRREAQFGAFWAIIPKFVAIPGGSIPIAILAAVGYVPNAVQTPEVVFTIKFLYSIFPAAFYVVALLIVARYPISETVHRAIRDGIDAHGQGRAAVDPLTGERIPAPRHRGAEEEETGWFLDHFTPSELRRALARGTARVQHDVARAAALSLAVCVGAVSLVVVRVPSLDVEPGPLAVLAVVTAGLALTLFLFHLGRYPAARRIATRPVPPEQIRAHLDGVR